MIGWIVAGGISVLAWLWLLICHGRFWRTDQRLPALAEPARWPSVAIVVPARDEAELLPASLPTLLSQRYAGPARVILVDDNSSDHTAHLAKRLAAEADGGGLPLMVTTPGQPPAGWTGKLWAIARGVAEAGEVDYLLFTDADIAHQPRSLAVLVAAAASGRDLVSQMALLRTETGWERLIVPAFVYFFAMLFPFRRVNQPRTHTAAAAGGCVLVRRDMLARAGGIAAIRGSLIDDVALAQLIKRAGGRIWLGLTSDVRSIRPYPQLADLWHMIARSAYTQLRRSPVLLTATVLGLALVFLTPPVVTIAAALTNNLAALLLGGLAWLTMAATFIPTLRYYNEPILAAFLLPGTALLYTLMTLDSACRHHFSKGATWKRRTYQT